MTKIRRGSYARLILFNYQDYMNKQTMTRENIIFRTSIIGIITNLVLAGFKATVGIMSNSIAIILDAVNNLSDVLSSAVTMAGTYFSQKKPDREHPMGHGRIEYLSAMAVAGIVLYAGLAAAVESIKKIANPAIPDYSMTTLVIIAIAVITKAVLGKYVIRQGKNANSGALEASGKDALFDSLVSTGVLVSAIFFKIFGVPLEAYMGLIISVMIIRSGFEMINDMLGDILGKRIDAETSKKIKKMVCEEKEVRGVYDLFLHNYGPGKNYASLHIEVPDTMTAGKIDELTRHIQAKVYKETGIIIAGIGIYSYNTQNEEAAHLEEKIREIVMRHEWAIQMHGFYADTKAKKLRFDVVFSFDINHSEAKAIILSEAMSKCPGYEIEIVPDSDISD